jgi:chemotaxis protein CheD
MFHRSLPGRICHAVLPSNPDPLTNNAFHYVDSSMQYMLDSMLSTGISRREIEVKAFGGANSFRSESGVGDLNAAAALRFVKKEGLKLWASDLGGKSGRKILFDTRTGMVLLKRLNTSEAQPLLTSCSEP